MRTKYRVEREELDMEGRKSTFVPMAYLVDTFEDAKKIGATVKEDRRYHFTGRYQIVEIVISEADFFYKEEVVCYGI